MQTTETSNSVPDIDQHVEEFCALTKPEISGYDSVPKPIFKEPSLYLSVAIVFVIALLSFSANPAIMWGSFIVMAGLAVGFHAIAERIIFKSKKEFQTFAAPFEGVFVLTFGSIVPGLSLIAYSAFALSSTPNANLAMECAKIALLLVVPLFNFAVWSAIRKGYLVRPRLIGLMSGLALGLSVSWSAILIKHLLMPSNGSCKFGWMLLLCISPFLLFSALCLSLDLWQKTEANIRRITTAFSGMGVLLSLLFVFSPVLRTYSIQSLINEARNTTDAAQANALSLLRKVATLEDLRPSRYPVSGFNLAELLIPNRGLETGTTLDQKLYFKVTGKSFASADFEKDPPSEIPRKVSNGFVGGKIEGLALARSQYSGVVDATSLTSALSWTLSFANATGGEAEAKAELGLPDGAVVSGVTIWRDGEPLTAGFHHVSSLQPTYDQTGEVRKDPVTVTMPMPNHVVLQIAQVPAARGLTKVRIDFDVPLRTADGKICSLQLPRLVDANFSLPRRHRIGLVSSDLLTSAGTKLRVDRRDGVYEFDGAAKIADGKDSVDLVFQRSQALMHFVAKDPQSKKERFLVQRLHKENPLPAPSQLIVVVDSSYALKTKSADIAKLLSNFGSRVRTKVLLADGAMSLKTSDETKELSVKEAQEQLKKLSFIGGHDNGPALRQALESAAEQPNSAVLWIHGPQLFDTAASENPPLDLVNCVRLYDLQTERGQASAEPYVRMQDPGNLVSYTALDHATVLSAANDLVANWTKETGELSVVRSVGGTKSGEPLITSPASAASLARLWAKSEYDRLIADGRIQQARNLASSYHIVTQNTGAAVLGRVPVKSQQSTSTGPALALPAGGSMVGAPIDPRYGQSNEVGMLADYGYDTARDISRICVAIAMIVSGVVALLYIRSRRTVNGAVLRKAAALVVLVPLAVHLLGTYMINNFGGLGGGL